MGEELVCCKNCKHLKQKKYMRKPQCPLGEGLYGYIHAEPLGYDEAYLVIDRPDIFYCNGFSMRDGVKKTCDQIINHLNNIHNVFGDDVDGIYKIGKTIVKDKYSDEFHGIDITYELRVGMSYDKDKKEWKKKNVNENKL